MSKVKRTERGWGAHFILASHCLFRRNTLLEYKKTKLVISTVGNMRIDNEIHKLGINHYYETMVFLSDESKYNDIDVGNELYIEGECLLYEQDDIKANQMHENVVDEFVTKLLNDEEL